MRKFFDDKMLGGDYSLKAKIQKDRILFNETKPFRNKKESIEKKFKTNIENMLEEGRIREGPKRIEELNAIGRKFERELRFEKDPYERKLMKLPNGKKRSVIVRENDVYKDWELEDDYELPFEKNENIIAIRQSIIDSLEIRNGCFKVILDYCTYSKEKLITMREAEKNLKRIWKS
jgi:hypothetical protein